MKILILLSFLAFTTFQCIAQQNQEKLLYLSKIEKYRRMKSTGTVLTVAGGIMTVISIGILANSSTTETYNGSGVYTTTSGNPEAGALLFLGGAAGLGAGIPLWIVGSKSKAKYENKLNELSAGVNLNKQVGLTLRYRF
jgi:hypothetical protein